jgi:hypothetical protein
MPTPGKAVAAAADADRKGDRIQGARTVLGDPSFVVGTADGQLAWSSRPSDVPHALWALAGDGPVEALRGIELPDNKGFAFAFRQGASIYFGLTHADKEPNGALSKVDGLGPQIGSPTLAASGDLVMMFWADRPSATDMWSLRWLKVKPGEVPGAPQAFALPSGGLGGHVMSPGLAALNGGRFLLAWTEGPVSSHQVRAQTLSADGAGLGVPVTVSADGVNAGQGQVAVAGDGHGAVVFLASPSGASAEVVATPISCGLGAM